MFSTVHVSDEAASLLARSLARKRVCVSCVLRYIHTCGEAAPVNHRAMATRQALVSGKGATAGISFARPPSFWMLTLVLDGTAPT